MNTAALQRLKQKVLDSDNLACFIDREGILAACEEETQALPEEERYTHKLETLLDQLPVLLDPDDVFAGRMREGRPPYDGYRPPTMSSGHITLPIETVLKRGLAGIESDVQQNAARIGTPQARYFEQHALRCIAAIRRFCTRYAEEAEAAGKSEMARALRIVPYQPAYDLYSALQSVWMLHFICSAVIGARDFAPGRLDQLLTDYTASVPHERIVELFAFFFVKFNELAGTATDNFAMKPVPCHASKQYIVLGPGFNALSECMVEAAELLHLPQPTLNFRVRDDFALAGRAAHSIDAQCNFFNDRLLQNKLINSGIPPEIAENYSFTACNRMDLPGVLNNNMCRIDRFDNSFAWFREAIMSASDFAAVPELFHKIVHREIRKDFIDNLTDIYTAKNTFCFDSLFLPSCVRTCRDIWQGGAELIRWHHRMFSGLANMADSMTALEILKERLSFKEIQSMLERNFEGDELLHREILYKFPKYGNGDERADKWATVCGNILIDAFEQAGRELGFLAMPSFYSLTHHAYFGSLIGATPDGRKSGDPISENQSPVHGMDRKGPTDLLKSVAALPLKRCICGGLNLKFACRPNAEVFSALMQTFFAMDGLHIGFTTVDRKTMEAARKSPEDYRTLLVRKTGFSEFFIALSPAEQQEMIDRTEYR